MPKLRALRPARLAAACGVLALVLLPLAPVLAHPFGLPPVAEIAWAGERIRTTFTVAMDDTLIMLAQTEAPLRSPQEGTPDELATQAEVQDYITSRFVLAVPEGPCTAEITGGRGAGAAFLFFLDHTCPAPVGDTLRVTNTFLRDISPEYRMVIVGRVGASKPRWDIDRGVEELTLDLSPEGIAAAVPQVPEGADPGADPEPSAAVKGLERLFTFLDADRGIGAAFVAVGIATALGALHALTPGHGKALVAAYLAGSDAKIRHAFAVGAALTITHTAAVLAFGVIAVFAGKSLVPQQVEPILMSVAAVLVVGLGLWLLVTRTLALRRGSVHTHHHHHLPEEPGHEHPEATRRAMSGKGIVAVGAAGGIVPCPEAFGLLFVAISLGRPAAGLLLLVGFSIGLAAVLVAIAVTLVLSRRAIAPRLERSRILRYLPVLSATIITAIGVGLGVVALGKF